MDLAGIDKDAEFLSRGIEVTIGSFEESKESRVLTIDITIQAVNGADERRHFWFAKGWQRRVRLKERMLKHQDQSFAWVINL